MLRQPLRAILRAPFFSAVVVLLLALGIGANALIFTAVDVLLLRPLPVAHPEQLVRFGVVRSSTHTTYDHAYVYARMLQQHATLFSSVIASSTSEVAFASGAHVESITANAISGDYFRSLGLSPALGRVITADDESRDNMVAVLSYDFWQRNFGGRKDAVGAVIRLRGVAFTVAGVLQAGFTDLDLETRPDVWVPIGAWKAWGPRRDTADVPVQIFLRLRPGVAMERARTEVASLYPQMVDAEYAGQQAHPDWVSSRKVLWPVLESATRGVSSLRKQFTNAVGAIMGGVAVLLLLVCANVSGLMLARSETHRREMAIRLSLGASRASVAATALGEALLLAAVGALGGLLIAHWGGSWLLRFLPARRPLGIELHPDLRVVAFAAGVCALCAILMSLLPVLHVFRVDLSGLMGRHLSRASAPRLGRALVALQVAVATMLVAGGLTLVRTLDALRSQDPGFRRENLIVMTVYPQMAGVGLKQLPRMFDEIVRRAEALPGVETVSLAQRALMRGVGFKGSAGTVGHRITFADSLNVSLNGVSLNHFGNMGMRLLKGRGFETADNRGTPRPAVVSESFARQFFPGADPIGQNFGTGAIGTVMQPDYQIVGVVNDAKYRTMREVPPPTVYTLIDDDAYFGGMVVHVRARGNAASTIEELAGILRATGPGLAPTDVATMEQEVATSLWQERLLSSLAAIFAVLASVLSGLGLFGMLAYMVSRRTREMGIRVAVGATVSRIVRLVGREASLAVAPGLAIGLAGYAFCSRALGALLYGVTRWDALSLAGAVLGLVAVALLAAFPPAVRAVTVEPSIALREE